MAALKVSLGARPCLTIADRRHRKSSRTRHLSSRPSTTLYLKSERSLKVKLPRSFLLRVHISHCLVLVGPYDVLVEVKKTG